MKRENKVRLINHISFFENELKDYENFKSLSWEEYNKDRDRRRSVERWIENIVNSSIDIAKIIIVSEDMLLSDTYREVVNSLSLVMDFDKENIKNISECIKLRNIISHEYLDIRWASIKRFIENSKPMYEKFLDKVKKYLERKLNEEGYDKEREKSGSE